MDFVLVPERGRGEVMGDGGSRLVQSTTTRPTSATRADSIACAAGSGCG